MTTENKSVDGGGHLEKPTVQRQGDTVTYDRILVVDDEPAIREVIQEYLSMEGYHVTTASDGVEAVEKNTPAGIRCCGYGPEYAQHGRLRVDAPCPTDSASDIHYCFIGPGHL
jgi:hypothetical protein